MKLQMAMVRDPKATVPKWYLRGAKPKTKRIPNDFEVRKKCSYFLQDFKIKANELAGFFNKKNKNPSRYFLDVFYSLYFMISWSY